ncbi:hypothetical protein MP228_011314 [Amoeboaphelidium protococcarum]|nr:hypothetical protein MP228_011314 [Amoeboaphelidium protococcarum]
MHTYNSLTIDAPTEMNLVITYARILNEQIRDEQNHFVANNFRAALDGLADGAQPYQMLTPISHNTTLTFPVVFIRLANQPIEVFDEIFNNGVPRRVPKINYWGALINGTGRNLRMISRSYDNANFNQRQMKICQYLQSINIVSIVEMELPNNPVESESGNEADPQNPDEEDIGEMVTDSAYQSDQNDVQSNTRDSASALDDVENTESQPEPIQAIVQQTASSSSVLPSEESDAIVDQLRNVRIDEDPENLEHVQVDSEATVDGQ